MQADALASRALGLDADLYEAHMARGDARRMLDCDWAAAESSYRRAIALNPSYEAAYRGYAMLLSATGRHGDAIRESERACELDPLCLTVGSTAAWIRYAAGDYEGALGRCRHVVDMDPEFLPSRLLLGAASLQAGRPADSIAELEAAMMVADADPMLLCWLAHARAAKGSRREAEALIERARGLARERHVSAYHLALAYVGVGDHDAAFTALDQASIDRDPARLMLAVEPRFEPLRGDPRYDALLEAMGLAARGPLVARLPDWRVDRL